MSYGQTIFMIIGVEGYDGSPYFRSVVHVYCRDTSPQDAGVVVVLVAVILRRILCWVLSTAVVG